MAQIPKFASEHAASAGDSLGADPFSVVTRGLDPRVHPLRKTHFAKKLRKTHFAKKMDCRVEPGNDGGETMADILRPFDREPH
jgi:hypothetical protein